MSYLAQLALLKQFRFRKLWNAALLFGSFHVSRFLRRPVHAGLPMSISIEPTTSCNLRCPECPSGLRSFSRPTGMLSKEYYNHFLSELEHTLVAINFYFQGEPFLNKDLTSMIRIAADKGIFTATSTNAHFLDDETAKKTVESGLNRLIVSIDGTTQETYEKYRIGGDLEKVIRGTKNVIRWKQQLKSRYPEIIFQFLVVRPNEHQINEAIQLGNSMGVDEVRFKTAQLHDFEDGNSLMPLNDSYSRYRKGKNGKWRLKNRLLNRCWRMWQGCVVTWDGKIVPCCFDKDASHAMGEMQSLSFVEIWKGEGYRNFRQAVLNGRGNIDICKNCTEGTKIWAS